MALLCLSGSAFGELSAELTLTNTTGADKTDWPVFLPVWIVFGPNLPPEQLKPAGFHVVGPDGREMRWRLYRLPPYGSIGNDLLVFVLPRLGAGKSVKLRITNTGRPGAVAAIDAVDNPNNLLPPLTAPAGDGKLPAGYVLRSNKGAKLGRDRGSGRSKRPPLVLTLPARSSLTIRSAGAVQFRKNCPYVFGLWAQTENVAHNGYGFRGAGVTVTFDPPAGRYQTGLMLASTGACYWHFWHTKGPFDPKDGKVLRRYFVPAMAAGFNDLRYYVALTRRIAAARAAAGPKAKLAAEAEDYLAEIFRLAPGDHDRHLMPHNGVPWHWGDVRFYDRWRARMKDYILKLRP